MANVKTNEFGDPVDEFGDPIKVQNKSMQDKISEIVNSVMTNNPFNPEEFYSPPAGQVKNKAKQVLQYAKDKGAPITGSILGGTLAAALAPETGGASLVIPMIGAGLGAGGAELAKEKLTTGDFDTSQVGKEAALGATAELGGQAIGQGVKYLSPYIKPFFNNMPLGQGTVNAYRLAQKNPEAMSNLAETMQKALSDAAENNIPKNVGSVSLPPILAQGKLLAGLKGINPAPGIPTFATDAGTDLTALGIVKRNLGQMGDQPMFGGDLLKQKAARALADNPKMYNELSQNDVPPAFSSAINDLGIQLGNIQSKTSQNELPGDYGKLASMISRILFQPGIRQELNKGK